MTDTATAPATAYTATTWADGYGIWHVRIDFPHTLSESDSRPEFNLDSQWARIRRMARNAVVRELAQREQTTAETYAQAQARMRATLPTLEVEKHGMYGDNTWHSITFRETITL